MKFHDFIESTYVKANIETQANYSVYGQAKSQAAQEMLSFHRKICKYINYIPILFHFLLIKIGYVEPLPNPHQIANKFKQDAKEKADALHLEMLKKSEEFEAKENNETGSSTI